MIKDFLVIPWKEIKRRKLRSWLTLLGVVIGIAAVVSLVLLGQGLQNAIQNQFDALGNDKLFITAKGSALTPGISTDAVLITEDDLEVVGKTQGVKRTAGMTYSSARIEYNDNVRYFFIGGMPTDPEERALLGEANSYSIGEGRSLRKGDKNKVVLGWSYTQPSLFDKEIELGDKITIQDEEFEVIGMLEKIGSPPDDQSVLVPLETYWDLLDPKKQVGFIVAQVNSGEDTSVVAEAIKKKLRKHRNVKEGKEDFNVETPDKLAGTFTTILDVVQAVLVGIALISLLVGGVGIMNTMYTAVLQRTKQIGVLKAVGAKNSHILSLFLVESGLYGLGGGLAGVIIGITIAKLVEVAFVVAVGPAFLSIRIDPWLIGGVLLFSLLAGCLSGIAPARRASKLNPVDSLRYE